MCLDVELITFWVMRGLASITIYQQQEIDSLRQSLANQEQALMGRLEAIDAHVARLARETAVIAFTAPLSFRSILYFHQVHIRFTYADYISHDSSLLCLFFFNISFFYFIFLSHEGTDRQRQHCIGGTG